MKKLAIVFFMILGVNVSAQNIDSTVELRLSLIENISSNGVTELLIKVSIINHSDVDVYIPELNYCCEKQAVHLYKENDNTKKWEEADYPPSGDMCVQTKDGMIAHSAPPQSKFYDSVKSKEHIANRTVERFADSLLYGKSRSDAEMSDYKFEKVRSLDSSSNFNMSGAMYMFLKAHQEIDNIYTWNLWYFIELNTNLKIAYLFDAKSIYKATSNNVHYPTYIGGYKYYSPKNIYSNPIYLTLVNTKSM